MAKIEATEQNVEDARRDALAFVVALSRNDAEAGNAILMNGGPAVGIVLGQMVLAFYHAAGMDPADVQQQYLTESGAR